MHEMPRNGRNCCTAQKSPPSTWCISGVFGQDPRGYEFEADGVSQSWHTFLDKGYEITKQKLGGGRSNLMGILSCHWNIEHARTCPLWPSVWFTMDCGASQKSVPEPSCGSDGSSSCYPEALVCPVEAARIPKANSDKPGQV